LDRFATARGKTSIVGRRKIVYSLRIMKTAPVCRSLPQSRPGLKGRKVTAQDRAAGRLHPEPGNNETDSL
jgi:hypothetical protein